MKATDKVTITFTGAQLAKIYAATGRMNGSAAQDVFTPLKHILDPQQDKYDSMILCMDKGYVWDYRSYSEEWETLLFSEPKSAEEIQLDTVMDRIAELTHQAEILKSLIKK